MIIMGVYIKKQMMLADSQLSPKQVQAQQFIDGLIESAHGDFMRVFRITQGILILGLCITIGSGVAFLACLHNYMSQ